MHINVKLRCSFDPGHLFSDESACVMTDSRLVIIALNRAGSRKEDSQPREGLRSTFLAYADIPNRTSFWE